MPLTPTTSAVVDSFEDVSFLMLDGERTVRVDVHRGLLTDIARSLRLPSKGYLVAFEEHRSSIEKIASAKYDEGDYQSYANSYVVPVKTADWVHNSSK